MLFSPRAFRWRSVGRFIRLLPAESGLSRQDQANLDHGAHFGRSLRSRLAKVRFVRRWGGPERSTEGGHVAVCQELFGFWPGSDTRACPVLRRAIARQV